VAELVHIVLIVADILLGLGATALVKTRLKRMQYRPALLNGFLAQYRARPHALL
jgi:hypothetical protein